MSTNIRFRRGSKEDLPSSAPSGMPLWCEDSNELYLGTGDDIVKIEADMSGIASGKALFEVFSSLSTETPPGAYPLWTGEMIPNCSDLFPDFWKKALTLSEPTDVKVSILTPMVSETNNIYSVEELQNADAKSYTAIAGPNNYVAYSKIENFPVGFKLNFNELQSVGSYYFSFSTAGSLRPKKIAPPTGVELSLIKEDDTEVVVWSATEIPQDLMANNVVSSKIVIDYEFKSVCFKIKSANANGDATLSNFQIHKVTNTLPPRIRKVTQEIYDEEVGTFSETGAFVINKEDGSLRLPKITRFISSIVDLSQVGTTHNDQILEHTHTYRTDNQSRPRGDDRTACFTYDAYYETSGVNGARKGNENLVKHVKMGLFIQVYNTVINKDIFDVSQFTNTLLCHTHPQPPQYFINSGVMTGTTTYVYPPSGYTMSNLAAFIPSINTIHFSGDVDYTDSLYCYYAIEASRITITCYNSEQRANPANNWLAVWRK